MSEEECSVGLLATLVVFLLQWKVLASILAIYLVKKYIIGLCWMLRVLVCVWCAFSLFFPCFFLSVSVHLLGFASLSLSLSLLCVCVLCVYMLVYACLTVFL
jgi:hypothetical protein